MTTDQIINMRFKAEEIKEAKAKEQEDEKRVFVQPLVVFR